MPGPGRRLESGGVARSAPDGGWSEVRCATEEDSAGLALNMDEGVMPSAAPSNAAARRATSTGATASSRQARRRATRGPGHAGSHRGRRHRIQDHARSACTAQPRSEYDRGVPGSRLRPIPACPASDPVPQCGDFKRGSCSHEAGSQQKVDKESHFWAFEDSSATGKEGVKRLPLRVLRRRLPPKGLPGRSLKVVVPSEQRSSNEACQ